MRLGKGLLYGLFWVLISGSASLEASVISGVILDENDTLVVNASVILCGQESGIPLSGDTFLPFTKKGDIQKVDWAVKISDNKGRFTFADIPEGEYRLVAQSWKDKQSVSKLLEVNGKDIMLHGIATKVKVPSEIASKLVLRPLGTGVLQLDQRAPNNETLLVISTAPLKADPILWFTGWRGQFMQNMIGGNRMPKGETTVYGLPEGRVFLALFAADSNGGCGAEEVNIRPGTKTVVDYIPIVCGWSNGQHDPPKELLPVFEEMNALFSQKDSSAADFFKQNGMVSMFGGKGFWGHQEDISKRCDQKVRLPSGQEARFADVIAVVFYIRLQKSVALQNKRRQERLKTK